MARFFTLIVAVWTLVLSAPLCISDVVTHPCETCVEACSHEAACPQDPCSLTIVQNETAGPLSPHAYFAALPLFPAWLPSVAPAGSWQEKALTSATPLSRNAYLYPIGAFPLLI
jgi:hypothetical protein